MGRPRRKMEKAAHCKGASISDLPENVLALVLGQLRSSCNYLRAARLVCRSFRAASITCITSIVVDPEPPITDSTPAASAQSDLLLHLLARNLQHFQFLSHVSLIIQHPEHLPLLCVPGVVPILRSLTLARGAYPPREEAFPIDQAAWASQLVSASGLTRLHMSWDAPIFETIAVLRACPHLEALHAGGDCLRRLTYASPDGSTHANALILAKGLRSLTLGAFHGMPSAVFYNDLLDELPSLSHLLELVRLEGWEEEAASKIGDLVGLTRLEAPWGDYHGDLLPEEPLGRLTALRTLCIWLPDQDMVFSSLRLTLKALPHLQDLTLASEAPLPHKLLGSLQGLTSLRLEIDAGVDPWELVRAPLSNLAVLKAKITPEDRPRHGTNFQAMATIAASLGRVRQLDVELPLECYYAIFPFLGRMTGLTALRIQVLCSAWSPYLDEPEERREPLSIWDEEGWDEEGSQDEEDASYQCSDEEDEGWRRVRETSVEEELPRQVSLCGPVPPVSYLSALTGLRSLRLEGVLDCENAPGDVPLLARHTELTCLSLDWNGSNAAFAAFVERGGLDPLSSLRMLSNLIACGYHMEKVPSFIEVVHQAQLQMGIPEHQTIECCASADHVSKFDY